MNLMRALVLSLCATTMVATPALAQDTALRDLINGLGEGNYADTEKQVNAIAATGATSKKEMGPVIKAVQANAAGRADGKTISALVGKLLP